MSKHQLQRLIAAGKTKGMINAYICPDLHIMVTKNMDDGFIPSAVGCMTCGQESQSLHFNVNQNMGHTIEWFLQTEGEMQAEMLKMDAKKAEQYKSYVVGRGLTSRLRPTDEDIKPFTKVK